MPSFWQSQNLRICSWISRYKLLALVLRPVRLDPPAGSGTGLRKERLAAVDHLGSVGIVLFLVALQRRDLQQADRDVAHSATGCDADAPDRKVQQISERDERDLPEEAAA